MRTSFLLLICLFFPVLCFSQTVTLKGTIQDNNGIPLESATIYLTSVKDSALIDYTISNRNGTWELKARKTTQPVYLKISFVSFSDYRQELQIINEDRDFGIIKLQEHTNQLDEVVIVSEIPPIRIKKDTLEFNAASFKVRPDANVEALLKQLPGVDIDSEGKITVNGKEVNQILVNGKPFFDKDGKIALQNLPAEIIDKVQVSDTKTKKEELTGDDASGNNASINLTIQEENNKGLFGKFMGGIGSDSRYESSGLLNYFKGKRKLSFLGSSNNINSTGFSMDEIFDNMSGGRNRSVYMDDEGGFGINGMQFGGGAGITRSNLIGLNYADEWVKGVEPNLNYFFNATDNENANRRRQITLLPSDPASGITSERNLITESSSVSDSEKFGHNLNTAFDIKIDSTTTIYVEPRFVLANQKTRSVSQQTTRDQDNMLQNESSGNYITESDNYGFTNNIEFFKALKKKGRSISLSLNNQNNRDDSKNINQSGTFFYEDTNGDGINDVTADIRDQLLNNRNTRDMYDAGIEYSEPVTDSLRLAIAVNYRSNQNIENRDGFDFDTVTGDYTALNSLLTTFMSDKTSTVKPTIGIRLNKAKYNFSLTGGTSVAEFDSYGTYQDVGYSVNRKYVLPSLGSYFNYRFGKSVSTYISYNYNVDFPQARQVLPIEDLSNPLSVLQGNPDLDPNKYHYFYLGLYDYDWATRSGYSLYAGGSLYDKRIVATTFIDASAKRFTNYTNVSGTYNTWFGFNWDKSIKKEAHTYKFGLGFNGSLNHYKGFTNGQMFESHDFRFSPSVEFTYEYGDLLTISPAYVFSYNESNYTNYFIDKASNFTHKFIVATTSYWPKHFVFGNDFQYNYNSNIADGFRKDFYLLNTSLGYNFLNDKMLFKVKVYDVLNQNLGATRTITATSIIDQENTVLKRYVMFSLTFKIEKFGAKEKKDDGIMIF